MAACLLVVGLFAGLVIAVHFATIARAETRRADEATARLARNSARALLFDLQGQEGKLTPLPDNVASLRRWIQQANDLRQHREPVEQRLRELRDGAATLASAARDARLEQLPRHAEVVALTTRIRSLQRIDRTRTAGQDYAPPANAGSPAEVSPTVLESQIRIWVQGPVDRHPWGTEEDLLRQTWQGFAAAKAAERPDQCSSWRAATRPRSMRNKNAGEARIERSTAARASSSVAPWRSCPNSASPVGWPGCWR